MQAIDQHSDRFAAYSAGKWRGMLYVDKDKDKHYMVAAWHESSREIMFNACIHPYGTELAVRLRQLPASDGMKIGLHGHKVFIKWVQDKMKATGDFSIASNKVGQDMFSMSLPYVGGPFDEQQGPTNGNPMLVATPDEPDWILVYHYDRDEDVMRLTDQLSKEDANKIYGLALPGDSL